MSNNRRVIRILICMACGKRRATETHGLMVGNGEYAMANCQIFHCDECGPEEALDAFYAEVGRQASGSFGYYHYRDK